jgi:hypothetical protein
MLHSSKHKSITADVVEEHGLETVIVDQREETDRVSVDSVSYSPPSRSLVGKAKEDRNYRCLRGLGTDVLSA